MSTCKICHGKGVHKIVSAKDYKVLTQTPEYKEAGKAQRQLLMMTKAEPQICNKVHRKVQRQLSAINEQE